MRTIDINPIPMVVFIVVLAVSILASAQEKTDLIEVQNAKEQKLLTFCREQMDRYVNDKHLTYANEHKDGNCPQGYFKFRDVNCSNTIEICEKERFLGRIFLESNSILSEEDIEPFTNNITNELYRLILIRSFDHPIIIRLTVNSKKNFLLKVKMGSGKEGGVDGLLIDLTAEPPKDGIDRFFHLLKKADFWNLDKLNYDRLGFDGATWVLEAVYNGKYHVVERWSPDKNDKFGNMCRELLKMAEEAVLTQSNGKMSLDIESQMY